MSHTIARIQVRTSLDASQGAPVAHRSAHYPIKLPLRMTRDLANFAALIVVTFLTAALLVAVR